MEQERVLALYDAYADGVYRVALGYLRSAHDAEDAVQETFIKAYDHIDELLSGKIESTKAWLMRIAVNTCKDTLRSSWMRHIDNRQEIEALPLSIASCAEERLALTQAIMALAPKHREIVLLYYYQDMSLRACAQVLGISAPTATRRLQQAQKKTPDSTGRKGLSSMKKRPDHSRSHRREPLLRPLQRTG